MSWAGSAMAAMRTLRQNRAMMSSQKKRRLGADRRELITKQKKSGRPEPKSRDLYGKAQGRKRVWRTKVSWFNRHMEVVMLVAVVLVIGLVLYMISIQ